MWIQGRRAKEEVGSRVRSQENRAGTEQDSHCGQMLGHGGMSGKAEARAEGYSGSALRMESHYQNSWSGGTAPISTYLIVSEKCYVLGLLMGGK